MKDLNNNRIEELLPRYCEGRLSEGERLEVEAWMDESEENKRVATQTFALYLAVDTVQVMKKVDTEKALLKVKGKMSDREVRRTDRKSTRLNSSHSQQSRMPSSA